MLFRLPPVDGRFHCAPAPSPVFLLTVMNRAVVSEFPAPVPYLPMFPSISATLLVEIRLGYVLLAYSLWYFVIYFGNAL